MQQIEIEKYRNPTAVVLCWWEVDCGDVGTFKVTDEQMNLILEAETRKIRFVKFNDFVLNVAFIRGCKRVMKYKSEADIENWGLDSNDKKFILKDNRKKMLGSDS